MQAYKDFLKSFGFLISEITGRKAEVAPYEAKMVHEAVIPAVNVG
jgi:hypothetical protein